MKTFKYLLANRLVSGTIRKKIHAPYSGEAIAEVFFASESEIETALDTAEKARRPFHETPSAQRSIWLHHLAEKLENHRDEATRLLALEAAKPIKYAAAEIERGIQTLRVAAEEALRIPGERVTLDRTTPGYGREGWLKYFPAGTVIGISPFNFPLNLALHKLAPAIAAGCPIILKPASATPLSMLLLAEFIAELDDMPEGSVSILPCSRELGEKMVTDSRPAVLSFTGSDVVGWALKAKAGRKKVVVELGGNAALAIDFDYDWRSTLPLLAEGAFAYQGQVCIHTQRIYVPENLIEEVSEALAAEAKKRIPEDPLNSNAQFSCMIDEANAIRVESWVQEAVEAGAKMHGALKREGNKLWPLVLSGTNNSMKIHSEEVFGPVVCVNGYKSLEEAIELINDSRFGLQAGIFTDSVRFMDMAFDRLEVGGIILNGIPGFRVDQMPYGGVKDSGLGREGLRHAMLDYMEPRLLVKNMR